MGVKRKITRASMQKLTLNDALEEFIEEKKSMNKSPATVKGMEFSVNKWIKYLEDSQLSLNCDDVEQSYLYSFQNHYLREDMKATTLNHYVRDIRVFVYWCIERGYITKGFKIKQITQQQTIVETYTDEEKLKLIAKPSKYANFVEWRSWAIINWILATGHRAGTVIEIKLGDVNYRKEEITVRQTKTNKAYITPLSKALSIVLKEYVRMWRSDATDDDYLFCNIGEEKLTVNALKHSINHYNRSRGVDKTSVHALRHTFAKDWIRNTGDVFRLQKLLGHTSLDMTRNYVNMFAEDLKEGFEDYNPLDRLKKSQSRTQSVKRNDM